VKNRVFCKKRDFSDFADFADITMEKKNSATIQNTISDFSSDAE